MIEDFLEKNILENFHYKDTATLRQLSKWIKILLEYFSFYFLLSYLIWRANFPDFYTCYKINVSINDQFVFVSLRDDPPLPFLFFLPCFGLLVWLKVLQFFHFYISMYFFHKQPQKSKRSARADMKMLPFYKLIYCNEIR